MLISLNKLLDQISASVSKLEDDKSYEQLLGVTYSWKKLFEASNAKVEKMDAEEAQASRSTT